MRAVVQDVVMRRLASRTLKVSLISALAVAAFGAILVGSAENAAACSCATFTDDEAIEYADAVFVGTLAEIVTPEGEGYSSADPERFVFEVDQVFKGTVYARQSIVTARDGASCGLEIGGPGPFVVFARIESDGSTEGATVGELYSGLCNGTRALSSGAIPASFGSPSEPMSAPISVPSTVAGEARVAADVEVGAAADVESDPPIDQIAALVGAVALGAAHTYRRRRRRTT